MIYIFSDKKEKEKSTTIPGISNWFEWSWPIEGDNSGYIQARAIPNIGNWTLFSPAQIQKFLKSEVNQPSPQFSVPTKSKSPWKISIPHASGNCHMLDKYNEFSAKIIIFKKN
jgi:hypothetical protein